MLHSYRHFIGIRPMLIFVDFVDASDQEIRLVEDKHG